MSQMKQIYSYNVTSNHAMSISLMHDPEDNFNPYFVFLNFVWDKRNKMVDEHLILKIVDFR
jgi:hypothetical protein